MRVFCLVFILQASACFAVTTRNNFQILNQARETRYIELAHIKRKAPYYKKPVFYSPPNDQWDNDIYAPEYTETIESNKGNSQKKHFAIHRFDRKKHDRKEQSNIFQTSIDPKKQVVIWLFSGDTQVVPDEVYLIDPAYLKKDSTVYLAYRKSRGLYLQRGLWKGLRSVNETGLSLKKNISKKALKRFRYYSGPEYAIKNDSFSTLRTLLIMRYKTL